MQLIFSLVGFIILGKGEMEKVISVHCVYSVTKNKVKVEAKMRTTIKYLFVGFFGLFAFIGFVASAEFVALIEPSSR